MKRLLVVYHSQSGATAALARAVCTGARREEEVETLVYPALEADTAALLAADGVLFGTPENLGYISGGLKNFFDRTYYPAQPSALNLPYGMFISAGNDGRNAVRQIERIARGYPLRLVAEPLIVRGEPRPRDLERCEELGQTLAAGLSLGIF